MKVIATTYPAHNKKRWPLFFYAIVIFLLTSDGIYMQTGDVRIMISKVLSIVFGLSLLAHVAYNGRLKTGGLAGYLLLLWIFWSLVVNFTHPQTEGVLLHWVNLAAAVIWFYILVNLSLDWKKIQGSVLPVVVILGTLNFAVILVRTLSLDPMGLTDRFVQQEIDLERMVMFSWEPNLFGVTVAIGLLMMLPVFEVKARWSSLAIGLLLVALVGSFSKGPWLAFAIGMLVYVLLTSAKRASKLLWVLAFGVTVSVIFMVAAYPDLFERNIIRVHNLSVRWLQFEYALQDIKSSPLFGNGTFSFGSLWPKLNLLYGNNESSSAWISQAPIGVLHDTGVVGLMLMLMFWGLIVFRAFRSISFAKRHGVPREFVLYASALLACAVSLLVQDWITTVYPMVMYWGVMGLVAYIPRWLDSYYVPHVVVGLPTTESGLTS